MTEWGLSGQGLRSLTLHFQGYRAGIRIKWSNECRDIHLRFDGMFYPCFSLSLQCRLLSK